MLRRVARLLPVARLILNVMTTMRVRQTRVIRRKVVFTLKTTRFQAAILLYMAVVVAG